MFRDSRGVVHTVCSTDPLLDLPGDTAAVLASALLRPGQGDLAGELERCDAVRELVERWQDAFFATLPDEVDLDEEARWAAEAGLSLEELEASYEDPDELDDELEDEPDELAGALDGDDLDLDLTDPDGPGEDGDRVVLDLVDAEGMDAEDPARLLDDDVVQALERGLLLLPERVRLEALVAASTLVGTWVDLLADHEKLLGHLVLAHAEPVAVAPPEVLWDRHARLHADSGPGHVAAPGPGTDPTTS